MASIILKNVTVDMPIYGNHNMNLKRSMAQGIRRKKGEIPVIRALEDVTITISDGERIGVVGPNGAGKTTLLRVISGALTPTNGLRRVDGSIVSLLGGDLGLEPQFSGRENIIRRGIFLNQSSKRMTDLTDDIIKFSELGGRIEHPVSSYSSGMRARLAFSISTALSPEILVVDEGFGMADQEFSEKASLRLSELIERTTICIIASHYDSVMEMMGVNRRLELSSGWVLGQ